MGMGQRKARARAYKQQTDKALAEEVLQPGVFSNTAVESQTAIECFREPEDSPLRVNDTVRLIDMRDRIDVHVGITPLGYVIPSLVEGLRARLKLEDRPGRSIQAVVTEVSELTPTFVVVLL
jgi:hypothetical protein